MALPLKYHWRHLRVRWRSNLGMVLSIALVVAVFVLVLALANGLRATLVNTGDPRNLLVIRKGALGESSSQVTVDEVRRTKHLDGVARDAQGEPLASAEVIVLVTLERRGGGQAHVQVRGLEPRGMRLRSGIELVAGRMFRPGLRECIVSRSVAARFKHAGLGEAFRSGREEWRVVGLFEARRTAYDSEIWVDADEAREAFRRSFYCAVVLRPSDADAGADLVRRIESDRAMRLRALTEQAYYREQVKTAAPIRLFGLCLAGVMGLGAAFAAMNTLYASVGARTREIGILRALGFSPGAVCLAFVAESVAIALVGGVLGCALASPLHGLATGTFNWRTFAEVAFEFRLSPGLLGSGLAFAAGLGLAGGWLPARQAGRKPILDALRAV